MIFLFLKIKLIHKTAYSLVLSASKMHYNVVSKKINLKNKRRDFFMAKYLGIDVGASLSKTGIIHEKWNETFKDYSNRIWAHDGIARTSDYDLDFSAVENTLDLSFKFGKDGVSISDDADKETKRLIGVLESERWILGKLADSMSSIHQTLSSDELKVVQPEFYLNILGVIYSTVLEQKIKPGDLRVGVLVPPRDYFNELKDVIVGLLAREITITNNTTIDPTTGNPTKIVLNFKESDITIKPESVVSFVACFMDDQNEITEIGEKFGEKLNVSIDMGHSTTDLAIMEEWKPKKNSFSTFDKATSVLLTYLNTELQRKKTKGQPVSESELVKAFSTGKITDGAVDILVHEELTAANQRFAQLLYGEVFAYLRSHNMTFNQVASFMFSGGGSVELKNVHSVRHFFMKEVRKVSENTQSFTPEEYISIEGHVDYEELKGTRHELSPVRYSNIVGFLRGLRGVKTLEESK